MKHSILALVLLCGCGPAFAEELFTNSDGPVDPRRADADLDAEQDAGPDKDSTVGWGGDGAPEAAREAASREADAPAPWCIAEPPAGWRPVLAYRGASAVSCPADFTGAESSYNGLAAPAAVCGCTCGPPTGVTCTARIGRGCGTCPSARDLTFADQACGGFFSGCNPSATLYIGLDAPSAGTGGSCAPAPSVSVPAIGWNEAVTTCSPVMLTGEGCGPGQVRLPERAGFRQCVTRDGDFSCPGAFPDRVLRFRGVVDTRGCSACTCSAPTSTCGGVMHVSNGMVDGCAAPQAVVPIAQGCQIIANGGAARYLAAPTGACTPAAVTPTGNAMPNQPVTVCCL